MDRQPGERDKWTGSLVSGLVPWVVTVPIAMGYFWLQASWMGAAERQGRAWAIPLLWVAMEFIRSYIPGLAFPWGHMATPLWPFPAVLQSAALGGIFLVSAWVVLVNQWLAEWRWPRADGAMNRWRTGTAVVIVALFGYSWWRASTPPEGNWHVVAAAQPGVDQAFTPVDEERIRLDGAGPELMADAERAGAELVVFPEGFASPSESVVPTAVLGYPPAVPVILGGNLVQGGKRYQTAYSWDGMQWKHANKTRLVVFGPGGVRRIRARARRAAVPQELQPPGGGPDPRRPRAKPAGGAVPGGAAALLRGAIPTSRWPSSRPGRSYSRCRRLTIGTPPPPRGSSCIRGRCFGASRRACQWCGPGARGGATSPMRAGTSCRGCRTATRAC